MREQFSIAQAKSDAAAILGPEANKNGKSQKLLMPTFPAGVWKDDFAAFVHDVAHARNTHPDMGDFVALQALSAAWGPAMDYQLTESWRKQCGLYSLLLAPTGRGKSRLFDVLMKPIHELEERVQEAARPAAREARLDAEVEELRKQAAVNALKSELKKPRPDDDKLWTIRGDIATITERLEELDTQCRLPSVWFSSVTNEFAPAIAAASGGIIALVSAETPMLRIASGSYTGGQAAVETLNSGFDGEPVGDGRMCRDDVKVRPRIACAWGSQPERLRQYAASCPELVYSGFLARFVLFIAPDLAGRRDRRLRSFDDSRVQSYVNDTVDIAMRLRGTRPVFAASLGAQEAYEEWATRWEPEYKPGGKLALLYGFSERIHDIAGRLAALLHVHHYGPAEATISADTMGKALAVTDWLIEQTAAAYRDAGIGQENELADSIWDYLTRKKIEYCTLRDIQHSGPGQRKYTAAQHRAALGILADEGKVKLREETTGRPGYPAVFVTVL